MKNIDIAELCAAAAHETNRLYCESIGDYSQMPWHDAPEWQKQSARIGVQGALAGNTPAESHALWLEHKKNDGWVYGPKKVPEAKVHPCMVPYEQLPPDQRAKDALFTGVVRAIAQALARGENG